MKDHKVVPDCEEKPFVELAKCNFFGALPVEVNGLTRFDLKKSVDAFRATGEARGAQ